jgi:hypothetical protein
MEPGHAKRSRAVTDAGVHARPSRGHAALGLQQTAGNAAMAQLLGSGPSEPRAVQRYQAPDGDWWGKLESDAVETGVEAFGSLPVLGNGANGVAAAASLGMAGYDAVTGDSKGAATSLRGAENFGMNAVPILGNLRSAAQAEKTSSTVVGDLAGQDPSKNQSSWDKWDATGAGQVNQGASDLWSGLF